MCTVRFKNRHCSLKHGVLNLNKEPLDNKNNQLLQTKLQSLITPFKTEVKASIFTTAHVE